MDALFAFFPFLLNDQHSFFSSIRALWFSELGLGLFEDVPISLGASGILVSLGMWLRCYICPEDLLTVLS